MKILALNGSPRMKASSTYHMLAPLLAGMEAAGAETELIHIRKLDLEACIGCYTCWVHTPGECIHKDKDGMVAALESYNNADMVIFGTPLYHFSMSGIMKTFIDRTLPRIEPWLIPHPSLPGVTFHPERFHKPTQIMLVSPCGFPEFEHFESLVATFRHIARMERFEYVGEILRAGAEPLSHRSLQGLFSDYYDLLRQAGEQIIRDGGISDDLQAELRKDLFPGGKQAFYDMADAYWIRQMDRFKVPEEMRHTALPNRAITTPHEIRPNSDTGLPDAAAAFADGKFDANDSMTLPEQFPQLSDYPRPISTTPPSEETPPMIDMTTLNCRDTIAGMPTVFDAGAAGDLTADIQFDVSGDEPGSYYLHIENGACTFHEGQSAAPSLTIHTPSAVWLAISRGELDGQMAFMQQKYTVEGDFMLLMKLNELFKAN